MNIIKPNNESEYLSPQRLKQYQESLQDGIGQIFKQERSDVLTDIEIDIINKNLNDFEMRKHTIQILNQLAKHVCNGEIPSLTLLEDVVCSTLYSNKEINAEMASVCYSYILGIQKIIYKLPDRKNIAPYFERVKGINYNTINSDLYVRKFRDIKGTQLNKTEIPTKSEPEEHKSTEIHTKHQKHKAQYETIDEKDYAKKFPNFKRTNNVETNVPLLNPDDIAFSIYNGGYECLTKHTKVPSFDIRASVHEFFNRNGTREMEFSKLDGERVLGNPYSFYNEDDDVSHIIVFGDNRGLNAVIHITIKGKVSQNDADDLLKYLKKKYSFEIDPYSGNPYSVNPYNIHELKRSNIQETVMNFFNNK